MFAALRASPVARQFISFAVMGAVATAAHYTLMAALVELARAPVLMSATMGYGLGALVSYFLNRQFTFSHRPAFGIGFARYLAVILVGMLFNLMIVAVLNGAGLHYLLAQAVATGCVLFYNFFASRVLVFRAPKT